MLDEIVFTNAMLVLPGEVRRGSLRVQDGVITDIDSAVCSLGDAVDCEGDFLSPGLIELHTDNLERHIRPRPRVDWPHMAAIIAHDAEIASAGITTVFDAMRVGSNPTTRGKHHQYARTLANEVLGLSRAGVLKASHFLHLRAEICSETLIAELAEFGRDDQIGIVSLMDHTPGQRQFRDLDKYEAYLCGKYALTAEEFRAHVTFRLALRDQIGDAHDLVVVRDAHRFGAVLASHDDTTRAQVAASANHGISLAEFPTTTEAAQACRDAGITVMMGAPNLIRGTSHSGNVAAGDLAQQGLLDIVSSDYVPSALLLAAVRLGDLWGDMARGLGTVTQAPARAVAMVDRGVLLPGKRADVIRFRQYAGVPTLCGVWSQGRRVA